MWRWHIVAQQSYGLVKRWNRFAILHSKQSVDEAICRRRLCPRADAVLCQTATEGVWDSDGACVCFCVCVHICAGNVHPHMDAHMYCVRSFMVVFLTQSVCVCVCDSECVYRGKMPRALFFVFFTLYFQTHKAMTLSIWNIKKCRAKPASDSSVLLTRLRSITSEKNTTKDLRNMRHENKFLDLNMERVIPTSTPRLLNIIRNREEILNVRKQTGWEYRGV